MVRDVTTARQGRPPAARGRGSDSAESEVRQVYGAHFGALAGWATQLVGDPDLGHDLAAEAFVRLLRSWESVDLARPWLYAAVAALVDDHWRGAQPAGPAVVLSVGDVVRSLPERLRMTVLLHEFADLTVAEVARELGEAEGTIRRDLHEARRRLAVTLEGVR